VMSDTAGMAMMGSGVANGENRACEAAERAISSPLLEDVDIHGARGILVNVTGNEGMTLAEYDEAVSIIHNMADEDANIICGMVYDESVEDDIRVTVVATGLAGAEVARLTTVSSTQEPVKSPVMPVMPIGAGSSESMPLHSAESGAAAVAVAGHNPAYDEDVLQVPTWIRRQAD